MKYFVGVVTGKGPQSARITLETSRLNGFFDCVKTGSIEGPVKQERIEDVISETGATRSDVLYYP